MTNHSIFKNLTNQYSLSKTLRFELRPHPLTSGLDEIISIDTGIKKLYENEMKPLFDTLHFDFISQSLAQVEFPTEKLESVLNKYRSLKEQKTKGIEKELEGSLQELRTIITDTFESTGNNWKKEWLEQGFKIKSSGYKVLTEEGILEVLAVRNKEKTEAINKFKGFFTYFSGFNMNRENYYSSEDKKTAVAYRVINENLIRFMDNILLLESVIEKVPEFKKYVDILSLTEFGKYINQAGIDAYNSSLVATINPELNKYHQDNPKTFSRLPKLKLLYKQIGSPRTDKRVFEIEKGTEWQSLNDLIQKQNNVVEQEKKNVEILSNLRSAYASFFENADETILNEVYFNKRSLNTISSFWFTGGWQTLLLKLKEFKLANQNKDGDIVVPKALSLSELKQVLDSLEEQDPSVNHLFKDKYEECYKENLWQTFVAIWQCEITSKFKLLEGYIQECNAVKENAFDKKKHKNIIKNVCDTYLDIEQMSKYLVVNESLPKYEPLYDAVKLYLDESSLRSYYDAFRNLISKRPVNEEKVKLNFQNSTLLDGWDMNKESANLCVLLKNNKGDYYLAVMQKKSNMVFDLQKNPALFSAENGNSFQKLEYKLLPGPNKMLPKVIFAKSNEKYFTIPEEIVQIRAEESFKKGKKFDKDALHQWIRFMQESIEKYPGWKTFAFTFKKPEEYEDVSKFYKDVEEQGYKLNWKDINEKELLSLVEQKKVYLFQIKSKDIGETKDHGNKNLHTMLFLELLKPENTNRLKLLGGGEMFYRAPSTEKVYKTINEKQVLDSKGNPILEAKRYYESKFFLHFPIQVKGSGNGYKTEMNPKILRAINTSKEVNIIGIDRGEKHLLYYYVIKPDGTPITQGSLNTISLGLDKNQNPRLVDERNFKVLEHDAKNKPSKITDLESTGNKVDYIDYQKILSYYELKRNIARRSWDTIGAIKNFKEGYLSQAIHQIYQLMLKYNAVVVLEDLNTEFKAKRAAKVEKSVYEKFEIALAKKLNHLIIKGTDSAEPGSVINPYQLTPAITAETLSDFKKSKQWGPLFYIRANYTSTTDPITGWRKHIYIPSGASDKEIKTYFCKQGDKEPLIQISYDTARTAFAFTYTHEGKKWTLHATKNIQRMRYDSKNHKMDPVEVYEKLRVLFIDFNFEKSLTEQLESANSFDWKSLAFLWAMLNQIRNTDREAEGNDGDFIQSPVAPFYDSRDPENKTKGLPVNGDANGAFNIARKGAILIKRIQEYAKKDPTFEKMREKDGLNLYISDAEWDTEIS